MLIGVLFLPFVLFGFFLKVPYQNLPMLLEGLFFVLFLCIALQYYYVKTLLRSPNGQRTLMIVVTYIQTGFLIDVYLLFHHYLGL